MGREGNGKSVGNSIVSTVSRGPIPPRDALFQGTTVWYVSLARICKQKFSHLL